ncbi:putative protein phosphatase 2C 2 [Acorus gramineus]|uniref:protein-serine/threonine phosphatase n=1 Tax=Acorus gramineus TaxID=55184 RepID=A0AAV9A1N4_ACOGR|nr:putative protein phosphatase 2C 2 [Acorus gramineus]
MEFEVEEREYCLASRKGSRLVMEDGYGVITNISGDPKQLGKNIMAAINELNGEGKLDEAIKEGYLTTDKEFLSQNLIKQGVSSGTCVATGLLKDGELHVANVGDCRVVLSRNGVAEVLTSDHSAGRDDERARIEDLGGYVSCKNGVWRIQDSLAVSRAIGDLHLKDWIISEPEIVSLRLMPDSGRDDAEEDVKTDVGSEVDEPGAEAEAGGEGKKRGVVVWWKVPFEMMKLCAFRVKPIWSFSVAVAMIGLVVMGRRLYDMKRKSRSVTLKVTVDDKVRSHVECWFMLF